MIIFGFLSLSNMHKAIISIIILSSFYYAVHSQNAGPEGTCEEFTRVYNDALYHFKENLGEEHVEKGLFENAQHNKMKIE
jgi:hypothetical protein